MHVLLVENNNLDQNDSLYSNLAKHGHQVWVVHTPENASHQVSSLWPNLVILHPSHNLLDIVAYQQAINQTHLNIPYLIVANKQNPQNSIAKNTNWLAPEHIEALEQNLEQINIEQGSRFLRVPGLVVDCKQFNVLCDNKTHSLTPKEFKLLHLLITHPNQVISRKKIMQDVWDTDYMGDTRTLDVHIRWLREKIEVNPSRPQCLITMRGLGYRFMVDSKSG